MKSSKKVLTVCIAPFLLLAVFAVPAFAAEAKKDIFGVAHDIIIKVYNSIAGISTILAGLMSAVAVISLKFSGTQQKSDQVYAWLKRIWGRVGGHQRDRRLYRIYYANVSGLQHSGGIRDGQQRQVRPGRKISERKWILMLMPILKELFLWLYGLFLDLIAFCANSLLGIMSTDLTYFEKNVPTVKTMYSVFIAVGWALLFGFGDSGTAVTASAARTQYDSYERYCNEYLLKLYADVTKPESGQAETYSWETELSGTRMDKNWFIVFHAVETGNNLEKITEETIRAQIPKIIAYEVKDKEPSVSSSGTPSGGTTHQPEAAGKPTKVLAIRYLSPQEYMDQHGYSEGDRNWAELMHRTVKQNETVSSEIK